MLPPVGGKESDMESSPDRERAYQTDPAGEDIEDLEARMENKVMSRHSRLHGETDALSLNNEDMEEKRPEKAPFSWSRIRESPAYTANSKTLSTREHTAPLIYTPANHQHPVAPPFNLATPRPPSSVYSDADTLQPPSPTYQSSAYRDLEKAEPRNEDDKQYVNYSRPSSSRPFTPSPAPRSVHDSPRPSAAYQCQDKNDLRIGATGPQESGKDDWEKSTFHHPDTSASPDCTPPRTPSPAHHHHPGTAYQPPPPSLRSPIPPSPLPPFYQPRRSHTSRRRKKPSFLLPTFIFPRMRKKHRKRLSGLLVALFFVGSLGMGIGFLIAGCGDDRRVGEGGKRVEWMIVAGGSILGLHGMFMIVMLMVYGPSCF